MKELARYSFILALICIIASGLLAVVNYVTKPRIIEQERREEELAMKRVFPDAERFDPVEENQEVVYHKAYGEGDKLLGVVFKASAKGYSSVIKAIVGITPQHKIQAINIAGQNETPGLGSRIVDAEFRSRFSGLGIDSINKVDTISGATISSRAVIEAVEKKSQEITGILENER